MYSLVCFIIKQKCQKVKYKNSAITNTAVDLSMIGDTFPKKIKFAAVEYLKYLTGRCVYPYEDMPRDKTMGYDEFCACLNRITKIKGAD